MKKSYWNKYQNICFKNEDEKEIENKIVEVFNEHKKQFGYRKITEKLQESGFKINHKKVLKLMNKLGLRAEFVKTMVKKTIQTQKSKGNGLVYVDEIKRQYAEVKERFTVLYTDITCLILHGQHYHQSTIIDGYTKEILDFKIAKHASLDLVLSNLEDAILLIKQYKNDLNGIIIHSDHGAQYTSYAWTRRCHADGLIISMGAAYTCADNIVIESFHSLLKKGTLHNNNYNTMNEYFADVIEWNHWYNKEK